MATYEEVIKGNINSLKELKDLIKSYKDELATAKEGSEEWKNAAEGLAVAQERVDKISKAAKGTLEGYNNSAKDSINTLKARIKELNTERNAMDMNSQEYKDATARLNEMNTVLRNSGVAAGDMKANVGNYAESLASGFEGVKNAVGEASSQMISAIGGLGQSMGGLSPVLGTVTTGMKGLTAATGAVGIALAAIAAILAAFKQGVESSEANTNKFKEALIPLQAILNLMERAIQDITGKVLDWVIALRQNEKVMNALHTVAQVIVTVFNLMRQRVTDTIEVFRKWYERIKTIAEKIGDVFRPVITTVDKVFNTVKGKLEPVIKWIIDKWNWLAKTDIGKMFGLKTVKDIEVAWTQAGESVSSFADKVEKGEKKIKENLNTEISLQKDRRDLVIANAKLEGDLAAKQLEINEARNEEVRDYDKILGLINEKTEIEKQLAQNNVKIKEQELAVIRQRNAMSQSNTKDLEAEAQAEAELIKAQNALTQAEAAGEKEKERILKAQRTEQRTEATNALTAAMKELEAQYTETVAALEKPIAPEGAEINKDSINEYHDAIIANYQAEYEAYMDMTEQKIAALEDFIARQKAAGYDTAQQEAEITKLRASQTAAYKKMIDNQNADDRNRSKQMKALFNSELKTYANLMESMSSLFEENTIAYKGTATAQALINTYLGATAAFTETPGEIWVKTAAAAAAIANGLANVMAIWRTDTKNPSVSMNTVATATATPQVDTTPYSYAQTVQTVAAEETLNQSTEPLKVYVLESDITDAQNKSRVRVQESEW